MQPTAAPVATPADLSGHVVLVANDGVFAPGHSEATVAAAIDTFLRASEGWSRRRLLLYVHGGLVDERSALETLAFLREGALHPDEGGGEVHVLGIVWRTGVLDTVRHVLQDGVGAAPTKILADAVPVGFTQEDRVKEAIARALGFAWGEMKENGTWFTMSPRGAGAAVKRQLLRALAHERVELHVVGHSAGSILLAPFLDDLTSPEGGAVDLASWTMWAPACTMKAFHLWYATPLERGWLGRATVFTLTPEAEMADTCGVKAKEDDDKGLVLYDHSLLHLVSRGFERKPFVPMEPVRLLGIAEHMDADPACARLRGTAFTHVLAPTHAAHPHASGSRSHGGFNDDPDTRRTLYRTVRASPRDQTRLRVHASPGPNH